MVVRTTRQKIRRVEEESCRAHKRRRAVELQIIFAFQDVVENTHAATDAGLAASGWVPGKAESRREIFLVGEVSPGRSAGIARKNQSRRRIDKPFRLKPRN